MTVTQLSGPGVPLFSPETILLRASSENFPVALRILRRETRAHLLAIYGFARLVDQIGDEAPGDRLPLLDWVEDDLERAFGGAPAHPLLQTLAPTIRALDLPRDPFLRLIDANRRDQVQSRYPTFADLVGYCRLSANPVGELVLHVFGVATPERVALSDAVCTALQLVEHWQDVGEDFLQGRVYLPEEDLERFGVTDEDLSAATASLPLRRLLAFEVERASALLDEGARLLALLDGRARLAIAGYIGGGRAAIDALSESDYAVLPVAPRPHALRRIRSIIHTLRSTS
ncbi:MAG TPA: squalene synthase HpnC [Gaiellaceae bacterium]|nr:squalene synthase HpnC [Gaiellaceae bacterium]